VCNSHLAFDAAGLLCQWCEFTEMIPSLDDAQNVQKWGLLEQAKRQLLNQTYALELPPYGTRFPGESKPLRFRFLTDTVNNQGEVQRVFTGHQDGIITINLEEADSVYREKVRVELNEPHRTLIGHLRHEYGHYLDWCLDPAHRPKYCELFGDPNEVDYAAAKDKYYQSHGGQEWRNAYVSEYATMHPWEDFAETTNLYLDLMAVLSTAQESSAWRSPNRIDIDGDIQSIVASALELAVAVSELNADLGLTPLLPENIAPPVVQKLAFIHGLRLISRKDLKKRLARRGLSPSR
jgi:hypothetical protein